MKNLPVAVALLAGLLLLIFPTGCYFDNEEDLYGPDLITNCDTAGMRFSVEIKQIMQENCNTCHLSSSSSYSEIPFETHAQFKAVALNGKLLDRINNLASPMPQSGLMSLCNRLKIEAWVKAGAPDN